MGNGWKQHSFSCSLKEHAFVFMRTIVKASSAAGSLSALCFCLLSPSSGSSLCPQPSKTSTPLLCASSHRPAVQGWHVVIPGLPSYLSYSGENIGMSPVTVKPDDSPKSPKSSKLPPEFPLTLFLGMPKHNLLGIQTLYATHCLHLQMLLGTLGLCGPPLPGVSSQSRGL